MEIEQYQQTYHDLRQSLQQAQEALDIAARNEVQSELRRIQHLVQSILNFDLERLPAAQGVKVQSYQTELNKQLRLLNTDLMFWQTARLSATQQQRQIQLHDRLTLLQRYCGAILAILHNGNEDPSASDAPAGQPPMS